MIPTPVTTLDSLIARSCRYITDTWYPGRGYGTVSDTTPAITWTTGNAGSQEHAVRGAAMAAFTLATPLFLGTANLWDGAYSVRRTAAARLLAAVARQHRAAPGRTGKYWGGTWQSPLWASWAGLTALLGWHDLIPYAAERNNVLAMLESEANYVLNFPVEYWRNPNGSPGVKHDNDGNFLSYRDTDTAAEESQWRGQCLWTAAALMPDHVNSEAWRDRALILSATSYAVRDDDFNGYNVRDDYLVVNHGIVHPDYSTAVSMNAWPYVVNGLLGRSTPRMAFYNMAPVWDALQLSDLDAQGTRAYTPNTRTARFPTGTPSDWGWRRPHAYAVFDGVVSALRDVLPQVLQGEATLTDGWRPPEYWLAVHLAEAGDMQFRPTSGTHPYGAFVDTAVTPREATYPQEEVYAASQLCFLRLVQEVSRRHGTRCVTS